MIKFFCNTEIIISEDLEYSISEIIKNEKPKNLGLIVDKNVSSLSQVNDLIQFLSIKANPIVRIVEIFEPTTEMVDENVAFFRDKDIDLFIGIGGGSTIDLTKAVSAMVVNTGLTEEYHSGIKQIKKAIKKIAIPTTAGTGSEVTPGAVLLNKKKKFKRALTAKCIAPDYAILNANLTLSMPQWVMAATGMDAIAHAVESYTAKSANTITRMYSKEAFRLVFNNLNKALEDKNNLRLREKILLGSCLAGVAIFNSNTGACHSMAYALGIYQNVPHGVAVGLMLDKVIKINIEKGCLLYADLLPLIEGEKNLDNRMVSSKRFYELIAVYNAISHIGKNFKDYGISLHNYEFLAKKGLDLKSALKNNPVDFDINDAKRVLRELI